MAGRRRLKLQLIDLPQLDGAACKGKDPAIFELGPGEFYRPGRFDEAAQICSGCPVRSDCDDYASSNRIEHGFWAGKDRGEAKHSARAAAEQARQARDRARVLGVDVPVPGDEGEAPMRVALAGEAAGGGPDRRSA